MLRTCREPLRTHACGAAHRAAARHRPPPRRRRKTPQPRCSLLDPFLEELPVHTHLLTHLRHVDLAVPDYDKQLDFYSGVWGLTKTAEDSGISFLAAEGSPEQYVVRL